jgi:hypothetical protein
VTAAVAVTLAAVAVVAAAAAVGRLSV